MSRLHWAARKADLDELRGLREAGANVEERDEQGGVGVGGGVGREARAKEGDVKRGSEIGGGAMRSQEERDAASQALLRAVKEFWPHAGGREMATTAFFLRDCVRWGADAGVADSDGATPAHYAARKDAVALLEVLREAGADLEALDQEGAAPAHWAIMGASPEALSFLLGAGVDPNARWRARGASLLALAAMSAHYGMCEDLIKAGAGFEPDARGVTPLHIVARRGSMRLARLLLEGGADALALDEDGRAPDDYARLSGDEYLTRGLEQARRQAEAEREAKEIAQSAASASGRKPAARI